MKYVKTFENFTSQINEEEEILKSIRKVFEKRIRGWFSSIKRKV